VTGRRGGGEKGPIRSTGRRIDESDWPSKQRGGTLVVGTKRSEGNSSAWSWEGGGSYPNRQDTENREPTYTSQERGWHRFHWGDGGVGRVE